MDDHVLRAALGMSFILGFINFHVLREVYAIFFSISSGMNFNYEEPGILRTKYLCVGSDYQQQKKVLRTSLESWGAIREQDRGWSCASYVCAPFSGSHTIWWSCTF